MLNEALSIFQQQKKSLIDQNVTVNVNLGGYCSLAASFERGGGCGFVESADLQVGICISIPFDAIRDVV